MKITLYKKEQNNTIKGQRVTISAKNGQLKEFFYLDFIQSGLRLATVTDVTFWGLNRVLNSYIEKGFSIIEKKGA